MKFILLLLATTFTGITALGQGTVQYYNLNTGAGVKAPIYGLEPGSAGTSKSGNTPEGLPAGTQVYLGAPLTGSQYLARLWGAPGIVANQSLLQPATTINTFRSGSAAGYLGIAYATFNNIPADASVATFQLRVWDNNSGQLPDGWAPGYQAPWGVSELFTVYNIGGMVNSPPPLVGLRSFNIYWIPEPGSISLFALGYFLLKRAGRSSC